MKTVYILKDLNDHILINLIICLARQVAMASFTPNENLIPNWQERTVRVSVNSIVYNKI